MLAPLQPSRPQDDPYGAPSIELVIEERTLAPVSSLVALEQVVAPDVAGDAGAESPPVMQNGSKPALLEHDAGEDLPEPFGDDEAVEVTSEVWTAGAEATAADEHPADDCAGHTPVWLDDVAESAVEEPTSASDAVVAENKTAAAATWSQDEPAALAARVEPLDAPESDAVLEAPPDVEREPEEVESTLRPLPAYAQETEFEGDPAQDIAAAATEADTRPWYRNPLITAAIIYLQLITIAELLVLADPPSGLFAHLGVFTLLLAHIGRTEDIKTTRVLIALTVAPITRLLSMVMPIGEVPVLWRYAMVAIPVLVSAALAIRLGNFPLPDVGMTWGRPLVQASFVLIGIPLGIAEYFILKPDPVVNELNVANVALAAVILLLFTGFIEELLFRGMLQRAMVAVLGTRWGIVYCALAFAVLHVGYGSELDLLFVFGVGLLFGIIVYRTGSIFGVSLAHGATNLILLVIAPFVAGHGASTAVASAAYEATSTASVMRTLEAGIPHLASTFGVHLPPSLR